MVFSLRIRDIQVGSISLPLTHPFKTALRSVEHVDDVVVRVIGEDGRLGYGEAPPTAVITGETKGSVACAVKEFIAPALIGMDLMDLEAVMARLQGCMVHNTSAKATVDMALLDLWGKALGAPLWRLLGGAKKSFSTDLTISVNGVDEMVRDSLEAVGRGFEAEGVLDDWMSMLRPRRRMQTLVEQLKQRGYCVYYLSNIPEDVLDLLMHRDFEGLFDGGVASCEVKINKPDPRIYQALLDKYHLRADECIFIDDRADNLVAASALGFGTYEMHGVGTLLRSLPTFGVSLH